MSTRVEAASCLVNLTLNRVSLVHSRSEILSLLLQLSKGEQGGSDVNFLSSKVKGVFLLFVSEVSVQECVWDTEVGPWECDHWSRSWIGVMVRES